jgi:hypothetical protein
VTPDELAEGGGVAVAGGDRQLEVVVGRGHGS